MKEQIEPSVQRELERMRCAKQGWRARKWDKWWQQGSMKARYLKWEGREKGKNIINTWGTNNVQGMVGDEEIIEKQLRAWKIPLLFQQPEIQREDVLLGFLIPKLPSAGMFQLLRSFSKGWGGPVWLGGLFRVTMLSKEKAAPAGIHLSLLLCCHSSLLSPSSRLSPFPQLWNTCYFHIYALGGGFQ